VVDEIMKSYSHKQHEAHEETGLEGDGTLHSS
jgi:hypothetical protein